MNNEIENKELDNNSQEQDQKEPATDTVENAESVDQSPFSLTESEEVSHETSEDDTPDWFKRYKEEDDKKRKDDLYNLEQHFISSSQQYTQPYQDNANYQSQSTLNPQSEKEREVREILSRMRQEEEQRNYREQDHLRISKLASELDRARRENPDFTEKVLNNRNFNYAYEASPALQERAKASPIAIDLLRYLATDGSTELGRITKMNLGDQLAEFGKIEAKLEMSKTTNNVSSAPPPIEPVTGSGVLKKTNNLHYLEEDHRPSRR